MYKTLYLKFMQTKGLIVHVHVQYMYICMYIHIKIHFYPNVISGVSVEYVTFFISYSPYSIES